MTQEIKIEKAIKNKQVNEVCSINQEMPALILKYIRKSKELSLKLKKSKEDIWVRVSNLDNTRDRSKKIHIFQLISDKKKNPWVEDLKQDQFMKKKCSSANQ